VKKKQKREKNKNKVCTNNKIHYVSASSPIKLAYGYCRPDGQVSLTDPYNISYANALKTKKNEENKTKIATNKCRQYFLAQNNKLTNHTKILHQSPLGITWELPNLASFIINGRQMWLYHVWSV